MCAESASHDLRYGRLEFDLDNSQWLICASRMMMSDQHIVTRSRQAVAILRVQQMFSGTGQVGVPFPR
jgi:hypothetical protein